MLQQSLKILRQTQLTDDIYRLEFTGDPRAFTAPGQFLNIRLDGLFLRRPISVCDLSDDTITIIYRIVGKGTYTLSKFEPGTVLDVLTGLGNGFDLSRSGDRPLLVGGGVGVPPLYYLAKRLAGYGRDVRVILGFNSMRDVILADEFRALGCETTVTTVDGSFGVRGFVTDALAPGRSYFYACGPEPMLKALCRVTDISGELSFESRMGCGFGACMGCSCETIAGPKRICKDGPVMRKEEILWND